MKRPRSVYMLAVLLGFLSLNAFGGSWNILSDVSGGNLMMTPANLAGSPFKDFTIPGLFLLIVFGIIPLFLIYGIIKDRLWGWAGSISISIILLLWLAIQFLIIGYSWMQSATALLALAILYVAFKSRTEENKLA